MRRPADRADRPRRRRTASGAGRSSTTPPRPAAISRRSVVRICGAGATCGTSAEIRTEYQYWGETLLLSAERRIDGASGHDARHDLRLRWPGRLLSTDGPLPGSDDATYNRYDVYGRRTWEIGAADARRASDRDPHHLSRLRRQAVSTARPGTIPAPTAPASPSSRRTDIAYDARRNPVREAVSAGGRAPTASSSKSFDDRGRLECRRGG